MNFDLGAIFGFIAEHWAVISGALVMVGGVLGAMVRAGVKKIKEYADNAKKSADSSKLSEAEVKQTAKQLEEQNRNTEEKLLELEQKLKTSLETQQQQSRRLELQDKNYRDLQTLHNELQQNYRLNLSQAKANEARLEEAESKLATALKTIAEYERKFKELETQREKDLRDQKARDQVAAQQHRECLRQNSLLSDRLSKTLELLEQSGSLGLLDAEQEAWNQTRLIIEEVRKAEAIEAEAENGTRKGKEKGEK